MFKPLLHSLSKHLKLALIYDYKVNYTLQIFETSSFKKHTLLLRTTNVLRLKYISRKDKLVLTCI